MTSLKIVVFPGLEEITYTTEKKTAAPQSNPVLEFLADRSSVTREELYTIEQLSNKQVEAEKLQRNNKNCRQFVCPPILDLAISSKTKELQPTHKPKRIFNGFFPSKIRTSTSPTTTKDVKYNQVNNKITCLVVTFSELESAKTARNSFHWCVPNARH